jgi:ABC-type multidrug transport system ATPase subunit
MTARPAHAVSPVLCADSVGRAFGARRVLTSATLRADAGEVVALVGRNGAGKSTLLKIAAGYERADYGTVHFAGRAYLAPRLATLAVQGMFYLPDRDILSTNLTVRAQLAASARMAARSASLVRAGQRDAADTALAAAEALGVAHCLDRPAHALSGGERRRAEVALAFARAPICLLLDEPYRGLAPMDAEALATAFRQLSAAGCAVVVTGHEVDTLLAGADRVVWCTAGTTHELGTPGEALAHFQFRREYLGPRR